MRLDVVQDLEERSFLQGAEDTVANDGKPEASTRKRDVRSRFLIQESEPTRGIATGYRKYDNISLSTLRRVHAVYLDGYIRPVPRRSADLTMDLRYLRPVRRKDKHL
jgi:hypothetical protein